MPLTTQGKEFKGAMRMLKSAKEVKTMVAVSSCPIKTKRENVRSDMIIGVVAQRYTQSASRYFIMARPYNSPSRACKTCTKKRTAVH